MELGLFDDSTEYTIPTAALAVAAEEHRSASGAVDRRSR